MQNPCYQLIDSDRLLIENKFTCGHYWILELLNTHAQSFRIINPSQCIPNNFFFFVCIQELETTKIAKTIIIMKLCKSANKGFSLNLKEKKKTLDNRK